MVRTAGLEPARSYLRQILSLLCLPIPPRPRREEPLAEEASRGRIPDVAVVFNAWVLLNLDETNLAYSHAG